MAPAVRAPAALDGGDRGDSDGGSGSAGEADRQNSGRSARQEEGSGTPEHDEVNAERAAEAPLRRVRVSVRARSEAPMVCHVMSTTLLRFCVEILKPSFSQPCWVSIHVCIDLFSKKKIRCMCTCRSVMDANGESMGRRWPRATRAPELTTGAQWPQDAPSGSRYVYV